MVAGVTNKSEKFVRTRAWVRDFCQNEENARRWIRYRQLQGWNYRHQMAFLETIATHVKLQPGERVLDLGCGEGILLRKLRKHQPDTPFEAYGLDISKIFLDSIRETMPWVSLVQGDAFCLPYKDAQFDTVFDISISGMFDTPTYHILLKEISRVLRPGGRHVARHNNKTSLYQLIEQSKYPYLKRAYTRKEVREEARLFGFEVKQILGDFLAPTTIFYRHNPTGFHRYTPEFIRALLYFTDVHFLARLLPWFTASLIVEAIKS